MTNVPKLFPWKVGGSVDGLDFTLFHEQVDHHDADGGTHSYSMYPFKIFTLEEEICIFKAEFQQCSNLLYGHGCSIV